MPRVDVLVTDLIMPGMNGDELAGTLRRRDPELRVLYVSALSGGRFAERVALRHGDALLEKPYSVNDLEQAFSTLTYGELGRPGRMPVHSVTPAVWM
jgi:CheY-like chemotaxis protein